MKQMILLLGLLTASLFSNAQNAAHWDENIGMNVLSEIGDRNKFSDIEMQVDGRMATFSHIPEISEEIKIVVTNTLGDEVCSKYITRMNNVLDLRKLRSSRTYFVSLISGGKTQKAFTIHL